MNVDVPFIMSTASTRSIEAVASASSYSRDHAPLRASKQARPRTNEVTPSILRRAKESSLTALVVTLDTSLIGSRPHGLDITYLPFIAGVGVQVGSSDPATDGQPLRCGTPGRASSAPA